MKKNTLTTKLFLTIGFVLISLLGFAQITQRGSATTATSSGTTLNISKPSGIAVGDIMIANFSQSSNSGAKTITNDVSLSGWTLIAGDNLGNSNRRGTVLYKIAVSTDLSTSSYTFSLDGDTDSVSGGIIAFSGVDAATPFDVTPGTLNITNTNSITATTLTTITANTAIIMLGQVGGSTSTFSSWSTTSSGTLTELFEISHNSGKKTAAAAAWAIKATAGSTGSGTATITNERNGSILLALRPAVACVTPPTTANAGSDQTLAACATTATLAGNTPIAGTGFWSLVSGTATITTPTSPTSVITGLTIGSTATLRWTISNGSCTPSTDDVDITTVTGSSCLTYCTPTYLYGTYYTADSITNVSLGTLNNLSGASSSPFYTFFNSATKPDLAPSTTASVSVTLGSDFNQYAAVWIDFNQNGTFETGEGAVSGNAGYNGTVTINIPVPAGALTGNTRMRVRGGDDNALTTSQACGASNSNYGETEDYIVNIVSLAPPSITSFTPSSGCAGSSITINGTNLSGITASNVKIGGTAVSSITSSTSTQIVAVIGSGTTGKVTVTTSAGTATSATNFTINPTPSQPSAISGNATPCSGSSQTYSVTNVSGLTYNWTFPSGWTQTAGGTSNSVTVTTNGTSGTITVTPANPCFGTAQTLSVSPTAVPSQPSTITGNTSPCVGSSQTYSVTNVAGTTYTWSLPVGWLQTAGGNTNSITVTIGATAGNIQATPSNSCGSGTARTLAVSIVTATSQPSTITGSTTPCQGSSIVYSVTNVAGTTYTWAFPSGWSQTAGGTTNSVTVTIGSTSGNVTVTPSNSCGSGLARTLATTVNPLPSQPSGITGNTTPCSGVSQTYSVTSVSGTTYAWSFPSGWSITAGGTTSSVTVTTSGNSGLITVTPSNGCGSGTAQTLSVSTTSATVNAGSILTAFCAGGTSAALGGSFGGSATGAIWSSSAGGTFANNTGTTPNTATWTPPPAYFGTATLTLTTTGGSCTSVNASKNQAVNSGSLTIATVGSELTIVGSLTSTSLGGNTPTSGTGSWSKISGPSGTVTFSSTSSPTATATVSSIGTYVFRWTITSSCGSSFAEITVKYISDTDNRKNTLFYEDFDGNNGSWTNTTNTNGSWLWTSSFPSGIGEIGENSFWRINNYNNYANNATIEIESPVYNFSGYENLLFSLDVRYRTETNNDGMRVLYSVNGGAYQLLGTNTSGENWYNTATVSALASNGWSGNSATSSLAFTPIGDGADRFLKASTLLADATFRNQSNVRFKIQFKSNSSSTDQGVAFDNLTVQGDPIVPLALSPNAPAKINQNLKLWFKSNVGISATDGAPLTSWEDQAYDVTRADLVDKENAKAVGTDAPTYRDNPSRNINFNPVADFNSANKNYMNGKGGLYSQDYFLVVHSDDIVEPATGSSGRQIVLGGKSTTSGFHEDPTGLGFGNATARYSNEIIAHNVGSYTPGSGSPTPGVDSYGRACTSTTTTYNEPIIINVKTNANGTETEIYKNGIKIDDTTGKTGDTGTGTTLNYYEFRNLPFYLGTGRSGISGRAYSALNGKLSEVIAYSAPNSSSNQQKIQSYLGIKYGITLHSISSSNVTSVSTTSRLNDIDYVDSQGNIFWNTTANTGFNYDIAGIGRDDNSQLQQKQSKSVNTTDDISIGLGIVATTNSANTNTFDSDRKFLVWGNNNGTLAAQPAVVVNMSAGITPTLATNVSFVSVGRTWKVVETGGDVPSCKVSIPTTMLSATLTPPGDYLMFISNTPNFDPTAEYRIMRVNGSNLETDYDFNGTKYVTFGFAPEKTFTRSISFDGVDDYLDAGNVLNLNSSFTVSAWINTNSVTSQTILSKRNSSFSIGYDLSINSAGKVEMSWINGTKKTITSNVAIPVGIWHNVAVTYNGSTALIYIDGVQSSSASLLSVPTNTQSFLIAAADGTNPTSFFKGAIDEVRVWKVALTPSQLRYVMNQEILSNGLATNGSVIPNSITLNDISSIPWANLSAYYPMSTYTYTNAKDVSNNNYTAALRNLTTVDLQTAPLPYESIANGTWQTAATWLNNTVQDLPNSVSLVDNTKTVDWNIVKTNNNITSTGNKTLLGLFVNSNTLIASSDSKIEVTNYLKLDGKIDLVGMSQLVQTSDSDLDVTSSGSIERDQQGQASKYNYNYWCSPVSPINSTQNNKDYTIAAVMKDGFNATPRNINWIAGYDGVAGNASTAVSIARYWLNKYEKNTNSYANWVQITENSTLRVGQGYTMKGSGTSGTQNYTFVGKPNNGVINSNTIGSDQLFLTGNPYPSALDADAFIADNISSVGGTDGTLYFWDHYTTNNTHILADYQGGYGVRNLTGGIAPVSTGIDYINQSGVSSKSAPQQFIPVGQGFFVNGQTGAAGTIIFKNSQRAFYKETDTANSNSMFKTRSGTSKTASSDHWNDNSNDTDSNENYKKIRLGFNSNNNYHRQLLLGFMDDKATDEMDYGYDAINLDDMPNDMYFLLGENQLVIQGVGYFDENASYPIGVKTDVEGKVSFTVDALENFDSQQKIYIYDKLTDTYNEIQTNPFEINLPIGTDDSRFSLRFKDNSANSNKTLGIEENNLISSDIKITHIRNENTLVINNNTNVLVEKVTLFTILGQAVESWKVENQEQKNIQLPLKNRNAGVYIAKLKTSKGEITKKIIL